MLRPTDLLAHYGGEDLVVVPPITDASGATRAAKEICKAVVKLGIVHSGSLCSPCGTVSVGAAAIVPPRHYAPAPLVSNVDQALHKPKDQGRNRVCEALFFRRLLAWNSCKLQ